MLLSTIILQAAGAAVWGKVAGAAGAAVAALAAAWGIGKIGQHLNLLNDRSTEELMLLNCGVVRDC